ncbi:four helix bundle protein [Hydrogenophaga sp.]|uniref:four helix bundle protein n=1 Tax=Hydrogenophaga sp. TaxID=1904254 RepID=UPI0026069F35|nr:four helix bundle protein [Hydrogenophaga sp.]
MSERRSAFGVRNYRELVAWQVSFALARRIYEITEAFPRNEMFGLTSQLRRAAVSIPSNLAEGAGRSTRKEFAHFVTMARGSLNEMETQVLLAKELGFVQGADDLALDIERLFALLNGLRNSLNAQRITQNDHG